MDQDEARRRRQVDKPKLSTKHPYAAIEHRVIDSDAYADLSFSARALLVQITRQLTKDNNGQLQVTYAYLKRYGFAENTIGRAVKDLIAHGMIYRTRVGGFNRGQSKYAVTWLSIGAVRDDLFLVAFKPCAWRDWTPAEKKSRTPNLRTCSRKNGVLLPATAAKMGAVPSPKFEDIELVPCRGVEVALDSAIDLDSDSGGGWIAAYLSRLAKRGLDGRQCFEHPLEPAHAVDDNVGDTRSRCSDDTPCEYWDEAIGEFRSAPAKHRATLQ